MFAMSPLLVDFYCFSTTVHPKSMFVSQLQDCSDDIGECLGRVVCLCRCPDALPSVSHLSEHFQVLGLRTQVRVPCKNLLPTSLFCHLGNNYSVQLVLTEVGEERGGPPVGTCAWMSGQMEPTVLRSTQYRGRMNAPAARGCIMLK